MDDGGSSDNPFTDPELRSRFNKNPEEFGKRPSAPTPPAGFRTSTIKPTPFPTGKPTTGSTGTLPEDSPAIQSILNPPSKTQRIKKSDVKKPHKVNNKPNNKAADKTGSRPSEVKPQAECDLLCSLGNNAKNLWDALTKGGKAGDLKAGLEALKFDLLPLA